MPAGRQCTALHAFLSRLLGTMTLLIACCIGLGSPPQNPNPPEIQGHEGAPQYQIRVERNLVVVRVVVRDSRDRTVGTLHRENFRLTDNGKAQEIVSFTVEQSERATPTRNPTTPSAGPGVAVTVEPKPETIPQRFVVLFFDDFHMDPEGIGRTRDAAWRHVTTSVRPQDRVSIFTATGKDQLDFTDDRDKLHDILFKLAPRPHPPAGCYEIDEYEAYLATQVHAPDALAILHAEALRCECPESNINSIDPVMERSASILLPPTRGGGSDPCAPEAERSAELQASDIWSHAELESLDALQGIDLSIRRLASMPGQRTLVLVSPGFLTLTQSDKIDALINRALHENVVVSALDAAGLYARNPHEIMNPGRPDLEAHKTMIFNQGTVASEDVLANLSSGTGGVYFHNSNDFDAGFSQTAGPPEVFYVLTFSPQNIKLDGKFHQLKVNLASRAPYTVQARRGYFATATALGEAPSGREELREDLFSLDETHGLPVEVSTETHPPAGPLPTLTVLIHIDLSSLPYHKVGDRSVDTLVFDTALFDGDGKYVTYKESSLDLHLKDQTLERLRQSGINAKTTFSLAPGAYRVREVVHDTESKEMSALNAEAQVPTR